MVMCMSGQRTNLKMKNVQYLTLLKLQAALHVVKSNRITGTTGLDLKQERNTVSQRQLNTSRVTHLRMLQSLPSFYTTLIINL